MSNNLITKLNDDTIEIVASDNSSIDVSSLDNKFKLLLCDYSGPLFGKNTKSNFIALPFIQNDYVEDDDSYLFYFYQNELHIGNFGGIFTIISGNTRINFKIKSRFENDNFLFSKYMLSRISGVNFINFPSEVLPQINGYDLLMFVFPVFLKNALNQGKYKAYRKYEKNDYNYKGNLDVSKFISKNIPFNGKFSFIYRDYTSNNFLILLVRYTIDFINKRQPFFLRNINDIELKRAINFVYDNSSDYSLFSLKKIISLNQKHLLNPFFIEYERLRVLCLDILGYKQLDFDNSKHYIYGVVYDLAWLWEEYLSTILTKIQNVPFTHADNRRKINPINFFSSSSSNRNNRVLFPDFYVKTNDKTYIVDAKYKHLGFRRDDFFQLTTYLHVYPPEETKKNKFGFFIYPSNEESIKLVVQEYSLCGYGGNIYQIGFPISNNEKTSEFEEKMNEIEKQLKKFFLKENI